MREFAPAVYILASRRNGTLYIGVTSDLPGRIWEHREAKGSEIGRASCRERVFPVV